MGISLKIKGNKRSNEGIGVDLVSIGDNRFPVIDAQYPGTKNATDFIVVRHLHDKSIYTIVCKNVTPCDSNREGTLYISVAVPVKEHVDGLFNMLIELQNAYKSSCMTYDGAMYHFMARNDAPQQFEEIMARHKVTRYPYRQVVTTDDMSTIAYLFMTPEQISDVLDDPMRGEFARFGQIVLVPVADPSQYVSTVNVPAKIWRSYKIYVNGRQTGQTLADPNKTVSITLPETSSHESVSTTFSIATARDTRMPGIAVDDEAQIIYLNMQPKAKEKPVETVPENPKHDTPRNNKLFYIIIGVLVAVIAVLAYFLLLAPKDEPKNDIDPTVQIKQGEKSDSITNRLEERKDSTELFGNGISDESTGNIDEKGSVEEDAEKDPSDKLLNNGSDTGKDARAELANQYKADREYIESAKGTGFVDFKFSRIKDMHLKLGNYTEMEGYRTFKPMVELANDVVTYIQSLKNGKPKATDYAAKIREFEGRAQELGMTGLKNKLHERIASREKIEASMKVHNRI